ncbi:MAG: 50S ribosomal protein L1 [Patescibacteria group bacterium]
MGKIRVKTIGDEQQEKDEQLKAKKRAEAKRAQKTADASEEEKNGEVKEAVAEKPAVKKQQKKVGQTKSHSKSYTTAAAYVDKDKKYSLTESLSLLSKLQRAKFDETVELHINTVEKGISGAVVLPHGTGKTIRVEIANQTVDAKKVEELVKAIEAGQINFDVLIATPDTMPKLARVAKVLGPRGLMPNPKNGTVTQKPDEAAKKFAGGQMHYKTEAKFPILHFTVGKASFGEKKLQENVKAFVQAVQTKNIKTVTIKSTMSPAVTLDITSL